MARARALRLIVAVTAATTMYLAATIFLFATLAMSECLPRSDPEIYLCDMRKQQEGILYLVLFLANPLIAVVIARKKTTEAALTYLVASSLIPFVVAIAYDFAAATFSR